MVYFSTIGQLSYLGAISVLGLFNEMYLTLVTVIVNTVTKPKLMHNITWIVSIELIPSKLYFSDISFWLKSTRFSLNEQKQLFSIYKFQNTCVCKKVLSCKLDKLNVKNAQWFLFPTNFNHRVK